MFSRSEQNSLHLLSQKRRHHWREEEEQNQDQVVWKKLFRNGEDNESYFVFLKRISKRGEKENNEDRDTEQR